MSSYKLNTPEGTRNLLFGECRLKRRVERRLEEYYLSKGFYEVITPTLEFSDVFAQNGVNVFESAYKLFDPRGRVLMLRPDVTMPVARVVSSQLNGVRMPLKLFYTQNVFAMKHGVAGSRDELTQSGVEVVGADGFAADTDILVTAAQALACCAPRFQIEVDCTGFYEALAASACLTAEQDGQIRRLIGGKNYAALKSYVDGCGNGPAFDALKLLPQLFGGKEVPQKARALAAGNEKALAELDRLERLMSRLEALGFAGRITYDLGLIDLIGYYTGIVFKGYVEGFGTEVLSGGRYNNLYGCFGASHPAAGFAINVDAVSDALYTAGTRVEQQPPQWLLLIRAEETASRFMQELTAQGQTFTLSPTEDEDEAAVYAAAMGMKKLAVAEENSVRTVELTPKEEA